MKILNQPIDMIACHDVNGKILPIKFQVTDNEEACTIKIGRVVNQETVKILGKIVLCFTCVSVINGIQKRYELRFHPETIQWVIYTM